MEAAARVFPLHIFTRSLHMITTLRTTIELSEDFAVEADSTPINRRLSVLCQVLICTAQSLWTNDVVSLLVKLGHCFEKEKKTKKRMKGEEINKGNCGQPTRKDFFFEILSNLNQAVPNHLTDEGQTR